MNKYIQNVIKVILIGIVYHTTVWLLFDINQESFFTNFSKNVFQAIIILIISKLLEIILNIVSTNFKKR